MKIHVSLEMEYHLLQIENWIVTLEYITRNDVNSGWLVRDLMPADQRKKESYLETQLDL